MKTKILSLILAASTALAGLAIPVSAESFSDISGSPYEEAVNSLAEQGIVSGRGDGRYSPEEELSRAEMVSIILRAYGSREIEDIEKFNDVPPTHWAYMQVETAYQMGIVAGTTEVTFEPDAKVTFVQAVKIHICEMNKGNTAKKLGGWPDGYIAVAEEEEVLGGVNSSKGNTINRGSMAQLVYNCLSKDSKDSYMVEWDGIADHYDWIRDEKIRGAYGSISYYDDAAENNILNKLEPTGVNTIIMNLLGGPESGAYDYTTMEGNKKMMDFVAEWDSKWDYPTFIKINFGDNGLVGNTEYGQFHPGIPLDSYFTIPCTLSDEYWEEQLMKRAEMIAGYDFVEGIVLDFEMYSGGKSQYTSKCMCDLCWNKYLDEKNLKGEWETVAAENRNEYLKNNGKIDAYNTWFEGKVTERFMEIRERIHAVNPEMLISYFPAYEWIPGMTKGLGTPEKPVIVFSENEYWGSLADTAANMQLIKENDIPAIYCPGLFPGAGALTPESTTLKISQAAPTTTGFWMYSMQYIDQNQAYYDAIAEGIKSLDADLASGQLTPLPEYEINSYTAKKIQGDVPTEEEWEKAPFTSDFVQYQTGEVVEPKTQCKVLYSNDNFFVKIIAYDDMSNVSMGELQERDANPWAGDCVEFFWGFDGATDCAQLVSDLNGSIWDAYSTGAGSKNTVVDFEGFTTETEFYDDRWEMNLTVPGTLDGITKIKKGDVLRLEIGRYHKNNSTNMCWAPTYGSYLGAKSLFGYVTLN